MAICENCGKMYLTRECLRCKKNEYVENINKNNKIDSTKYNPKRKTKDNETLSNKKRNILMIIIATAVTIIALIMIRNEYVKHQEEKMVMKMLYGTDDYDKVEKINNKLMKQNEKTMKQLRNLYIPK